MRRSHRGSVIATILLACTAYTYWSYAKYILTAIVLMLVVRRVVNLIRNFHATVRNLRLQDVDTMDGITFEHYVTRLLIEHGYTNVSHTEQYDYGVDIVAEKDGIRWGIQVKRYSGLVKAAAVR